MDNEKKFIDVDFTQVDNNGNTAENNGYNYGNGSYTNTTSYSSASQQAAYDYAAPKKKKGIFRKMAGGLALALAGGVIGGTATYGIMNYNNAGTQAQNKQVTYVPQSFSSDDSEDALSPSEVFQKVSPAVVTITTGEGMGSGFIINEEGNILTNYHVISSALNANASAEEKAITVTLSTGDEVSASIVNYDQERDVAMLKLADGASIPAVAELGDSDELYPGAEVVAIGTPLSKELAYTLTKGIISGAERSMKMTEDGSSLNFIQTDAAINSGNSGGPLVNSKGQVVGINSMKINEVQGAATVEGLGFAIPINDVKAKIDTLSKQILNLGIGIRAIDENLSKKLDLPEGLYVSNVEEFSPAEKAGIKAGDVIVACDGKDVKDFDTLKEIKQSKDVGDTMSLTIIRRVKNGISGTENKTVNVDVVLEELKN